MTEVYEKAMEAIGEVQKAEAVIATEPNVTFTMPITVAIQAFASLHVVVKCTQDDMAADFKRQQLPSPYTRKTLDELRAAVAIMFKAIRGESSENQVGE